MLKQIVSIFLIGFLTKVLGKKGCSFLYSDFPDKEPVLLYSNFSLIEPRGTGIELNINDKIVLACPHNSGSKNRFVNFESSPILAKCTSSNKLDVNGKSHHFNQFDCVKSVTGAVSTSDISGSESTKLIGYNISSTKWVTLFHIRYDDNKGEAIYSEHTLYGTGILDAKKESSRPGFKTAGLGPGLTDDVAYKQVTEKRTFSNILDSTHLAKKYINPGSYLARGHLSPDGDFVYVSSQYTTYFYINTVPQWQVINNGNWKSMEGAIRKTAGNLQQDFKIITGGFKTLILDDIYGDYQGIYLIADEKLPVPKFVWKIMYSPESKEGIGFVCHNDPFTKINSEDYLCKNICDENNWGTAGWKNSAKGLLYCCDVNEMKKIISTIPDIEVNSVLAAKKK